MITCVICGFSTTHRLDKHLRKHGLNVYQYRATYNSPTCSEFISKRTSEQWRGTKQDPELVHRRMLKSSKPRSDQAKANIRAGAMNRSEQGRLNHRLAMRSIKLSNEEKARRRSLMTPEFRAKSVAALKARTEYYKLHPQERPIRKLEHKRVQINKSNFIRNLREGTPSQLRMQTLIKHLGFIEHHTVRKENTLNYSRGRGRYLPDSYHPYYKLVIEADGGIHNHPAVRAKDTRRDNHLHEMGYGVLRFTNEYLDNPDTNVTQVVEEFLIKHDMNEFYDSIPLIDVERETMNKDIEYAEY